MLTHMPRTTSDNCSKFRLVVELIGRERPDERLPLTDEASVDASKRCRTVRSRHSGLLNMGREVEADTKDFACAAEWRNARELLGIWHRRAPIGCVRGRGNGRRPLRMKSSGRPALQRHHEGARASSYRRRHRSLLRAR